MGEQYPCENLGQDINVPNKQTADMRRVFSTELQQLLHNLKQDLEVQALRIFDISLAQVDPNQAESNEKIDLERFDSKGTNAGATNQFGPRMVSSSMLNWEKGELVDNTVPELPTLVDAILPEVPTRPRHGPRHSPRHSPRCSPRSPKNTGITQDARCVGVLSESLASHHDESECNLPRKKTSTLRTYPKQLLEEGNEVQNNRPSLLSLNSTVSRRSSNCGFPVLRDGRCASIVTSPHFENVVGLFILANTATIAIYAHVSVVTVSHERPYEIMLEITDQAFTAVFLFEFMLRVWVYGFGYYCSCKGDHKLNVIDGILVFFPGMFTSWIAPLYHFVANASYSDKSIRVFGILRTARLFRLIRVAKKMLLFKEAWVLIRGITDSTRTLFWTVVVICSVTFLFSIFGLLTIVKPLQEIYDSMKCDPNFDDLEKLKEIEWVLSFVSGVDLLMFTLIQVLMSDSFHAITRPILEHIGWSWMFWYAYIGVAVLVLMNLVTAVIVEHALSNSKMDEDQAVMQHNSEKDRELQELKNLFELMDVDGSGTLSWEEFQESFIDVRMSRKWTLLDFKPRECKELFSLLDDGDGEIETEEFFNGLGRMRGVAQSKDIFRLQKHINALDTIIFDLAANITRLLHQQVGR